MVRETFQDLMRANRRNSFILVLVMMAFLLGLGAVFGGAYGELEGGIIIGGVVALVMFLIAYFMGGDLLMSVSGAQEIEKKDAPQLYNVVEEIAISAGLPMPRIFIIDEEAPNAFATGADPEHAAVAITTGLLEKLTRDELQGVMAHEMGHVRNLDIRYTMLVSVMAGAIVLLSDVFLRCSFWAPPRRRDSDRDNGGNAIALVLMLIGVILAILSPIITEIIKMAISRQREYLADATAVEFTRNPEGLASALEKLSSDPAPMKVSNAAAALFIVNPELKLRSGADSIFSTHPPIEERIKRLRELEG